MSTTGLSNTWDLFPNRTLGRVGKRESGGKEMNKAIFFFPVYFWLLSRAFVEDPLHSSEGFEVLKRKDKRGGFSLDNAV